MQRESKKTLECAEVVKKLTTHLQYLDSQRAYLTKFAIDETNAENPAFARASEVLTKLKTYINEKKKELSIADGFWLCSALDDLEAEMEGRVIEEAPTDAPNDAS